MLRKLLSFICCILFLTLLNTAGAAGRGTILFVPLDNRPVCLEYSVNSMQAAGWNVETPPEEYIASNHRSGNPDKLYEWLAERAPLANAVIVSSDAMLYGGLVDSRTHHIDREVLKERAERLVSLKDIGGDPLVYVFTTIMRSPRASAAPVEPPYYAEWGSRIFQLGELEDREDLKEITRRERKALKRLRKEIADIEMGEESYAYHGAMNGHPGISCMIFQTAGSNATEVNNNIDTFLEEARKDLPKGVEMVQVMSSNDFLYASIHEVIKTLFEAIFLVILIVYVFLQDIRSTIIPLVGIIVSLIGTFAFMSIAGFSINLITLFALVLVIGTVVDDAIVVVEAVQARFDVGYRSSYIASIDAMKGISNAVISSSLVFMAVFIPVSFMSGTSGTFYTQFGLTMAVAVGISAVNALTLSPALCALFLKPYINEDGTEKNNFAARFRKAFNAAFDAMIERYKKGVLFFIKRKWMVWTLLAASVVLLAFLMNTTKTSLVPDEDQGLYL